jgi:hypothetical protein
MDIEIEKEIVEYTDRNHQVHNKLVFTFYKAATKNQDRKKLDTLQITHEDIEAIS